MVTSTVVKNTFGVSITLEACRLLLVYANDDQFGMTYYINDWIVRDGFIPPTGLLIGLTIALTLVGMVILMIWGKKMRRWTKNSKYHQL